MLKASYPALKIRILNSWRNAILASAGNEKRPFGPPDLAGDN